MVPPALVEVLEEAQRRGLLGPGPVDRHIRHALAMGEAAGRAGWPGPAASASASESGPAPPALDLGTGGGLPGLVLATAWPHSRWVLLDSRARSTTFCREAVARLRLEDRVEVLLGRAERVGRDRRHRGRYPLATARGFGPPAVTAECAAPLLATGGHLVVSEPPGVAGERWPAQALSRLGLALVAVHAGEEAGFVVLEQQEPCPETFPRREGVPAKRPLFP